MNQQLRYATRSQHARLPVVCTKLDKILAARNVISKRWTQKDAAEKMGCVESTIFRWVTQLKNGECMHDKGGKPAFISLEQKQKIIAEVAGTTNRPVKICGNS